MKRVALILAALAGAGSALGVWVYEGQWGKRGSGPGEFYTANDVAYGTNGLVYVADGWGRINDRIQYFTATGSYLGEWGEWGGGNGQFHTPEGVAFSAANSYVYVADTRHDRIQYFTATGSFVGLWGRGGTENGCFENPHGLDVAPNGNVYVADTENNRVQYFTPAGSFLGKWGAEGSGPGEFRVPYDVAVAPNGWVYVVERANYRVQYFTPTGTLLGVCPRPDTPGGAAALDHPEAVAVAPNGDVFVVDIKSRVVRFDATGKLLETWGSPGTGNGEFLGICGITTSTSGARVYVAEYSNCRIQYFNRQTPAVAPASLGRVKALFR